MPCVIERTNMLTSEHHIKEKITLCKLNIYQLNFISYILEKVVNFLFLLILMLEESPFPLSYVFILLKYIL